MSSLDTLQKQNMNDFLLKFFSSLFTEENVDQIPNIINALTIQSELKLTLKKPQAGLHKKYYLASSVATFDNSSPMSLRGIYDANAHAFWVSKGDSLIKITGAPFQISRRLLYLLGHVRTTHGANAEKQAKLLRMHLSKIANHLDLAKTTGLYVEINAPESNAQFLQQYTAIPYQ